MTLKAALERLRAGKGSIRCGEVIAILESLGFVVKRRGSAQHHAYNHQALAPEFKGANFGCPHRSGEPVKNNYISNVMRVLRQYEDELLNYLGESND